MAFDRLIEKIAETQNPTVAGLDPKLEYIPASIRNACFEKYGKLTGIHAHNNQQLAFANTIDAMAYGASYLDATVDGMGRGAGNCALELLLGFLKNPKYKVNPIIKFIQQHMNTLREEGVKWGYDIPYMLTGQYNTHPRPAIQFVQEDRRDYFKFANDLYDIINS